MVTKARRHPRAPRHAAVHRARTPGPSANGVVSHVEHMADDLKEMGAHAADAVGGMTKKVGGSAAKVYKKSRTKARKAERTVEKFVHDRPVTSGLIGTSILVGIGLGVFFGRVWMKR